MEFKYLYVLIFIPFFLLLFGYLWYGGRLGLKYIGHTTAGGEKLKGARWVLAKLPCVFLVFAILAGFIALAGPLGERIKEKKTAEVHQINLIIDVSGSMNGGVRPGHKITKVVECAKDLVRARKGDLIGVIPFSGEIIEKLVVPLTTDTKYLVHFLDKLLFYDGDSTAIGEGLLRGVTDIIQDSLPEDEFFNPMELREAIYDSSWTEYARYFIEQSEGMENAINIVLTDSGNNEGIDPIAVLAFSRQVNIKTYAIRISVVEDKIFQYAIRKTGGKVYDVENVDDVKKFLKLIDQLETKEEVIEIISYKKPLYCYPLVFSLICLFLFVVFETVCLKIP